MSIIPRMKATLSKHIQEAPDPQFVEEHEVDRYHTKFKEKWFHECEEEHKKITAFYQEKRAEAVRRFVTLKVGLQSF